MLKKSLLSCLGFLALVSANSALVAMDHSRSTQEQNNQVDLEEELINRLLSFDEEKLLDPNWVNSAIHFHDDFTMMEGDEIANAIIQKIKSGYEINKITISTYHATNSIRRLFDILAKVKNEVLNLLKTNDKKQSMKSIFNKVVSELTVPELQSIIDTINHSIDWLKRLVDEIDKIHYYGVGGDQMVKFAQQQRNMAKKAQEYKVEEYIKPEILAKKLKNAIQLIGNIFKMYISHEGQPKTQGIKDEETLDPKTCAEIFEIKSKTKDVVKQLNERKKDNAMTNSEVTRIETIMQIVDVTLKGICDEMLERLSNNNRIEKMKEIVKTVDWLRIDTENLLSRSETYEKGIEESYNFSRTLEWQEAFRDRFGLKR